MSNLNLPKVYRDKLPIFCTPEEAINIAEKVMRDDLVAGSKDVYHALTQDQVKKMAAVLLVLAEHDQKG